MKHNDKIITILNEFFKYGFHTIKLKHNSKEPKKPWKDEKNWIKDISQIDQNCNIGIICDKLLVFDADTKEAIEFLESNFEIFRQTATVTTRKGKHYYFLKSDPFTAETKKIYKNNIKIDVKADNSYVVAPPSRIDSHTYTFEKDLSQIKTLNFDDYSSIVYEIRKKLNLLTNNERQLEKSLEETEELKKIDLSKLKDVLKKRYSEGVRQDIVLYASAFLRKNGIDKETCEKFITELCFETQDRDIKQRLSAVDATYQKSNEELKGFAGLLELGFDERELNSVFENDEYTHLFDEFYVKDDILFEKIEKQKSKTYIMIAPAIFVVSMLHSTDGFIEYEIRYKSKTFKIKNIKDIPEIEARTGIAVVREKRFLEYLNKQAIKCKIERKLHTRTGWNDDNSEFYHPLSTSGCWKHILIDKKACAEKESDKFITHIKNTLIEGRYASVVYIFSISALLNKLLNTNPSVLVITGTSGCGKTTVSKSACNIFYDTDKFELTMNTTKVAAERIMSSMQDLTILFDEVALQSTQNDLEKLVFMAHSRAGKARSDKQLSINISELNSNIIVTSEAAERKELKRAGALRRMLYLSVANKSDFSEFWGDIIKSLNYKICFHHFVKFIQKIKNSDVFIDIVNFADNNAKTSIDLRNIIKSLYATCKMLEYFYETEFKNTYKTLTKLILEQELELNDRKDITNFMNTLQDFITINQNKFITPYGETKGEIWGKIDNEYIYIVSQIFYKFMKEHEYNSEVFIKELKKANILITSDKLTVVTRLKDTTCRCFKLKKSI